MGTTPSEQPNFENFNDSGETPGICVRFRVSSDELSASSFNTALTKSLNKLGINENAVRTNPKLTTLVQAVSDIYAGLIERLNERGEFLIWKFGDGHYHYLENGNAEYNDRKRDLTAAIKAAKEPGDFFHVNGSNVNIKVTFFSLTTLSSAKPGLRTPKVLARKKIFTRLILWKPSQMR